MRATERSEGGSEQSFASTTWEFRRVRVRRAPQAPASAAAAGRSSRWRRFPRRNPRDRIQLVVKSRGGPECWYEISARGETNRYPGWVALHDLMRDINQSD